jgi:hypothetical protein
MIDSGGMNECLASRNAAQRPKNKNYPEVYTVTPETIEVSGIKYLLISITGLGLR